MSRLFNGVNGGIAVATSPTVNNMFATPGGTFAAWVLMTAGGSAAQYQRILDKRATGSQGPVLGTSGGNGVLMFFHDFSTTDGRWVIANSLTANVWHHVAVAYSNASTANTPVMFFNGVAQTVTTRNAPVGVAGVDTKSTILIGSAGSALLWTGGVAHVHYYQGIQLDANQVRQIMAFPGSLTHRLSGYWPLHGYGTQEGDYSGNANPGSAGTTVSSIGFRSNTPPVSAVGAAPLPSGLGGG